MNVTILDARLK